MRLPIANLRLPISRRVRRATAFSLVEVLLVVTLLSLIVLALMAVFNGTQRAFRASVTQTDVLEGGRMAMDLVTADLRGMTPSDSVSNSLNYVPQSAVNFFTLANSTYYAPLVQTLPGSTSQRTNLLNYFFILGRVNTKWTATAYIVDTATPSQPYALYRFYAETNTANSPLTLYNQFVNQVVQPQWTTNSAFFSHILDGVVHLTARAYDTNGTWINNFYQPYTNLANAMFIPAAGGNGYGYGYGEAQLFLYSNAVPASVDIELGVLEDQALARAESLAGNATAQQNYLAGQSGAVHLFRQRVAIPNLDTSAYQ
jgi:type II secretory pathway pseudopilin PulG